MPPAPPDLGIGGWLACVGLGAVLGLDATSFPQAMVSRPLVAATLGGWLLGDPAAGFVVGLALELLDLRTPPFGAARYPDPGPAGLVAGAASAAAGGGPAVFAISALLGWVVSRVGGRTVHWLRLANGRLVGRPEELSVPRRLEGRHRWAIGLDAARAALLTAGFLMPALLLARVAAALSAEAMGNPAAAPLAVAGLAAAAGTTGRNLGAARRLWPLVAAGAALALLGLG